MKSTQCKILHNKYKKKESILEKMNTRQFPVVTRVFLH